MFLCLLLVEMTFGLVHASYSLPEWQAVKLTNRQAPKFYEVQSISKETQIMPQLKLDKELKQRDIVVIVILILIVKNNNNIRTYSAGLSCSKHG